MTMLWYRAWVDTRVRFLVGLAIVTCATVFVVAMYPSFLRIYPNFVKSPYSYPFRSPGSWEIDPQFLELSAYRAYITGQLFLNNVVRFWCLFAAILGSGGLLSRPGHGGGAYALSLPVSRERLVMAQATMVLLELFVLAFVPALLVPVLSPLVGQSYVAADVVVHGASLLAGGTVFFATAFLLSSVFRDIWRPLLIAIALAFFLGSLELSFRSHPNIFRVMAGDAFVRGQGVPWSSLFACVASSTVMVYGAVLNIARRDF